LIIDSEAITGHELLGETPPRESLGIQLFHGFESRTRTERHRFFRPVIHECDRTRRTASEISISRQSVNAFKRTTGATTVLISHHETAAISCNVEHAFAAVDRAGPNTDGIGAGWF
jgi:hypothetical protein